MSAADYAQLTDIAALPAAAVGLRALDKRAAFRLAHLAGALAPKNRFRALQLADLHGTRTSNFFWRLVGAISPRCRIEKPAAGHYSSCFFQYRLVR